MNPDVALLVLLPAFVFLFMPIWWAFFLRAWGFEEADDFLMRLLRSLQRALDRRRQRRKKY